LQPRGFFIDGSTGEVTIRIPQSVSLNVRVRLLAEVPGTLPAVAANLTFDMLPADIDNPNAVGPNGQPCQNGAKTDGPADGVIEFDEKYTCACDSGFVGDNCDLAIVTSTATAGSSTLLSATVGAMVGVLLVGLAVGRFLVQRARRRPVDMAALQDEILASLGLGGAVLSVGRDQVGLALTFESSLTMLASDLANPDEAGAALGEQLLTVIRRLHGLPPRLARMLRDDETTATVNADEGMALVLMKRPRDRQFKTGTEEAFAAALQTFASARKLSIAGMHFVKDVAVAVPHRVPKELRCVPRSLQTTPRSNTRRLLCLLKSTHCMHCVRGCLGYFSAGVALSTADNTCSDSESWARATSVKSTRLH
jgi:hypothetical protein